MPTNIIPEAAAKVIDETQSGIVDNSLKNLTVIKKNRRAFSLRFF
ncbi:hypothetical protein [Pseudomonas sp. MWU13-3659]|nr:hypothetical protein [Pseudomonas sp. MWU13-3659]